MCFTISLWRRYILARDDNTDWTSMPKLWYEFEWKQVSLSKQVHSTRHKDNTCWMFQPVCLLHQLLVNNKKNSLPFVVYKQLLKKTMGRNIWQVFSCVLCYVPDLIIILVTINSIAMCLYIVSLSCVWVLIKGIVYGDHHFLKLFLLHEMSIDGNIPELDMTNMGISEWINNAEYSHEVREQANPLKELEVQYGSFIQMLLLTEQRLHCNALPETNLAWLWRQF